MPAYFTSDVHLRLDRPERSTRFERFLQTLQPDDTLTVVGDLCDFWFASRQRALDPFADPALRALVALRDRGIELTVLLGNHDGWLGPFYESTLHARVVNDSLQLHTQGLRIHLQHGHTLGTRPPWKAVMESRSFLHGFGLVPSPIAGKLASLLDDVNDKQRAASDLRYISLYRAWANAHASDFDLCLFGHIHRPTDDLSAHPRLIVPGSWHRGGPVARLDEHGLTFDPQAFAP